MNHRRISAILVIVSVVGILAACSPHRQYRTDYALCTDPSPEPSLACQPHAIQQTPTAAGASYLLNFIELDDQGVLWSREQLQAVVGKLYAEAASNDLLMVVFVHGWKHSAAPLDGNIQTFRKVLAQLADEENYISRRTGQPQRVVAGIYIGWRGGSLPIPVIENVTFWDRKNTAQKVGHGGVTEVLSRLEVLQRDKASSVEGPSATKLVVVGHSFGGAVVHTALSQILAGRFTRTRGAPGSQGDIDGFGDLVVLINPAFEATLFTSLSDMATERGTYFKSQLPVLAILTSEADDATRVAFPLGRRLSTIFEKTRDTRRRNAVTRQEQTISEGAANVTSVGHFRPYRTHRLYPAPSIENPAVMSTDEKMDAMLSAASDWENDAPGSKIRFNSVILERTDDSAGRNPYLVAQVDGALIHDHNDIDEPRIIDFLKQLIFISTLSENQKSRLYRTVGETVPVK